MGFALVDGQFYNVMLAGFLALRAGSNRWDEHGDRQNVLQQRQTLEDPRQREYPSKKVDN